MGRFAIIFLIGLLTIEAGAAEPLVHTKVKLNRNASSFELLIGDKCHCSAHGTLVANQKVLHIHDKKSCGTEIGRIAKNWQGELGWSITVVGGSFARAAMAKTKLEQDFGKSPSSQLRILSNPKLVPCLVFASPVETQFAADQPVERTPRRSSKAIIKDQFFEDSLEPDRGLYMDQSFQPYQLDYPSS